MKRRAVSFITVLALCLSLCPMRALAADREPEASLCPHHQVHTAECGHDGSCGCAPEDAGAPCASACAANTPVMISTNGVAPDSGVFSYELSDNTSLDKTYTVTGLMEYILKGHEYSYSGGPVFKVATTGALYLLKTGGTVKSGKGAGIEVAGGSLYVEDPDITIAGTTYGLDISSFKTVELSGGTFKGDKAAIQVAGNDYAALLASGCAFFDENGKPIPLTEVKDKTTVTVKECTDHVYDYTADPGAPTHDGTCKYCRKHVASEMCTFSFDTDGLGACAACKRKIKIDITVDENSLVYNGALRPDSVNVAVMLDANEDKTLNKNDDHDYTVEYTTGVDAGDEFTVTVKGKTYNGTFEKIFSVTRAKPVIKWSPDSVEVKYNGAPVDRAVVLPEVTINAPKSEDLKELLVFSYRESGSETDFADGLPTDAGTYEIKASLPELPNYEAAETQEYLKLIIDKIDPIIKAPEAVNPVYNHSYQKLVTPGVVWDGAAIQYSLSGEDDTWSTDIPTGINAGEYTVYYKVEGTNNFLEVVTKKGATAGETGNDPDAVMKEPIAVKIGRKQVTPDVKLEYTSCIYDGGKKEPTVTVTDPEDNWELPSTEYKVTYTDNKNVGTATVKVEDSGTGNYTVQTVGREFRITTADQAKLEIINVPQTVSYGDVFTLNTSGGSGSGGVNWEIVVGGSLVEIKAENIYARIKATGVGIVTVKATKAGDGNHEAESAYCSFEVKPKQVTATVIAKNKIYDGNDTAVVEASVAEKDIVSGDTITITGLEGKFSDANVGTGKTVIVEGTAAVTITDTAGTKEDNYIVTIPTTSVTADIAPKPVEAEVTPELPSGGYVYDGKQKEPPVKVTYTEDGKVITVSPAEYTVAYRNNVEAGTAAVTVTARAGGNYTFTNSGPVEATFPITRGDQAVLTSAPQALDLTYNGNLQNLVAPGEVTGGYLVYALKTGDNDPEENDYKREIPQEKDAGTYTVYYKVKGDGNHADAESDFVTVTVRPKTVTDPAIKLDLNAAGFSAVYDGKEKKPSVTKVIDEGKDILSELSACTVTYSNNTNAGTATVHFSATGKNYIVDGSAAFEIKKADIKEDDITPPTPRGLENTATHKWELQYNGAAQELITRGSSPHGKMVYSLNDENGNYSEDIPTAAARGSYTIYYKVLGDSNHNDSAAAKLTNEVTIEKNTVTNPTITLSADTFRYNGSQQKPTVTVRDDNNLLIAENEYVVTITGEKADDPIVDVGTYTIEITASTNSNYIFEADNSKNVRTYKIVAADQETISITGMRDQVYYGDKIQLGIIGGSGEGTVKWSITSKTADTDDTDTANNTGNEIGEGGLLTIKEVGGPYIVTATRTTTGGNYDIISTTWEFSTSEKPVTAVLTGVDRDYKENDTTVTVKATVNPGDLVGNDKIVINDLTGNFDDADVGTNKKITLTSDLTIDEEKSENWKNYAITYLDTATASVKPVKAAIAEGNEPQAVPNLTYTAGKAQALVTAGTSADGTMVYSLDGNTYFPNIPTGTNAGTYKVYYKVQGDSNHTDSDVGAVSVTIASQSVTNPEIEFAPPSAPYDGTVKRPAVIVRDNDGHVIPESEYKVMYEEGDGAWIEKGEYTVTIKDIEGGNYSITDTGTENRSKFTVTQAEQAQLTIDGKPGLIYFGDRFTLSAVGGSGDGAITWTSNNGDVATIGSSSGLVEATGVGTVTITAEKAASTDGNYKKASVTWTFAVVQANAKWATEPRPASGLTYTGSEQPLLISGATTVNGIGEVEYSLSANGTYSAEIYGKDAGTYTVWYRVPDSVNWKGIGPTLAGTVTIAKKEVSISGVALNGNGGTGETPDLIVKDKDGNTIPASEYTVMVNTENWKSGSSFIVTVTARPDGNYHFEPYSQLMAVAGVEVPVGDSNGDNDGTGTDPSTGDANNTPTTTGPGAEAVLPQTTVQDGTASTVVSDAAGDELVNKAIANQSENVVIKPEITGDVTKAEVSIPASAVSRISSETDAALIVSTPVADVTIPNGALDTLSGAGSTVSIVTEQVDNTIVLTLTADGKDVGDLPGGLTLTVPVEDAGPGTVAVLVYEDGTRETVRKSVAEDGGVRIPLNGSATVEIVDNSREFVDVPAENWAADAVAFASAHELFNGTSETTFSPGLTMSRAMLATVLYNLEGRPGQGMTGEFSDISNGAWYTEGVSWAAENGIVGGYGNGQFGPNDSITREQLVVMLWRYAGSPSADTQTLNFTDADQVSSYAVEALCWAIANGLMKGPGDGRLDPGGITTRAQAAQMLKNFLENT